MRKSCRRWLSRCRWHVGRHTGGTGAGAAWYARARLSSSSSGPRPRSQSDPAGSCKSASIRAVIMAHAILPPRADILSKVAVSEAFCMAPASILRPWMRLRRSAMFTRDSKTADSKVRQIDATVTRWSRNRRSRSDNRLRQPLRKTSRGYALNRVRARSAACSRSGSAAAPSAGRAAGKTHTAARHRARSRAGKSVICGSCRVQSPFRYVTWCSAKARRTASLPIATRSFTRQVTHHAAVMLTNTGRPSARSVGKARGAERLRPGLCHAVGATGAAAIPLSTASAASNAADGRRTGRCDGRGPRRPA